MICRYSHHHKFPACPGLLRSVRCRSAACREICLMVHCYDSGSSDPVKIGQETFTVPEVSSTLQLIEFSDV